MKSAGERILFFPGFKTRIDRLLDVIDATAVAATGRARDQVVVEHPLQPFDARNFEPGALVAGHPWSFDRSAARRARAPCARRAPATRPFLPGPLPAVDTSLVDLDDLVRFVQHPTRPSSASASASASATTTTSSTTPSRSSSTARSAGASATACSRPAWPASTRTPPSPPRRRAALLPPLALGQRVDRRGVAARRRHRRRGRAPPRGADERARVDVRVELGADGVVAGTVDRRARHDAGRRRPTRRSGREHRLAAWVRLLALAASDPATSFDAVTVGRAGRAGRRSARIPPIAADEAAAAPRATLVDLYRRGHARAAAAVRPDVRAARPAAAAARRRSGRRRTRRSPRRTAIPSTCSCSAASVPFADLLAERPAADEARPGLGRRRDASRAERYAHRLWDAAASARRGAERGRGDVRRRSTCAGRCRPASPCSRRAPARARRSRSPPSPPATWPPGRRSSELLLVTFGRAATSELRDRVRGRLVSAEAGLAGVLAGVAAAARRRAARPARRGAGRRGAAAPRPTSPGPSPTSTRRRSRRPTGSAAACCTASGSAGDVERGRHVRRGRHRPRRRGRRRPLPPQVRPPRPRASRSPLARRIGREVVGRPDAAIEPAGRAGRLGRPGSASASPSRCAREVERRKRRQRRADLRRPADPARRHARAIRSAGRRACARLRERYAVVMVDEFQDTDPTQWEIVERAFGDGATTLVLIGDPKQAIYAFRGADVHAYLDGRRRRPDGDAGLATGAATRACSTPTTPCSPAPRSAIRTSATARCAPPTATSRRACCARAARPPRCGCASCTAPTGGCCTTAQQRAGGEVVRRSPTSPATSPPTSSSCCRRRAELVDRDAGGAESTGACSAPPTSPCSWPPTARPRPCATALRLAAACRRSSAATAACSPHRARREWLRLLQAVERPSHAARVRSVAALTCFFGWSAERRSRRADDAAWEDVYVRAPRVGRRAADRAAWRRCSSSITRRRAAGGAGAGRRRRASGRLTDLRHVGELLHHAATTRAPRRRRARRRGCSGASRGRDDVHDEERSRRLESDADAVQVLTIHRSKGLEFPVVYCPYLWAPWSSGRDPIPVYHDDAHGGRRTIDVGGDEHAGPRRPRRPPRRRGARRDDAPGVRGADPGPPRRPCCTGRAAPRAEHSPLGPAPVRRRRSSGSRRRRTPSSIASTRSPRRRRGASASSGRPDRSRRAWSAPHRLPPASSRARPFDRPLDMAWRRTSYSGLTAAAERAGGRQRAGGRRHRRRGRRRSASGRRRRRSPP